MWKSYLSDKIKRNFFQAMTVSVLFYSRTTWNLTIDLKKKIDMSYTRMLRAV